MDLNKKITNMAFKGLNIIKSIPLKLIKKLFSKGK